MEQRHRVAAAEEAVGQVACCPSSPPCPGNQDSLLGSGDISLLFLTPG